MDYIDEFVGYVTANDKNIDKANLEDVLIHIESSKIRLINSYIKSAIEKKVEWVNDKHVSVCDNCYEQFTLTNRKHHCRECGNVFCGKCSNYWKPLPLLGYNKPVRLCITCYYKTNDNI